MAKTIDVRAVEGILYGVYKALHEVTGNSAASIMRRAAPDILEALEKLGADFSSVKSIERLEEILADTMIKSGACDDMKFELNGNDLKTTITNCAFFDLTMALKEKGIQPFGCPFAALTIALAERNLGKRARVKLLQPVPGGNRGDTELIVELHDRS